jgi:Flp pilus assembly protein TadB
MQSATVLDRYNHLWGARGAAASVHACFAWSCPVVLMLDAMALVPGVCRSLLMRSSARISLMLHVTIVCIGVVSSRRIVRIDQSLCEMHIWS